MHGCQLYSDLWLMKLNDPILHNIVSCGFCLLLYLIFSSSGQDLWVKLNEVEMANNMLCPYQSLTMICKHPSTLNQPDWVVFNNTDVIFRSVNFQSGQLPNHSIVYDTNSEEVLMIHSLLPEFDGLMYYCLYDTINGEVRSNNLTVDIPG